ncbi:DMT family transporter [Segetibacter sp.]|jgi:drug/metabolite transporter (DMT)-like permease|uniref:DMT family transporter n=1 Tax=Segetibacter sp. TaxID=2231182 RepID=UPI00261894E9|nr:DMT family transporter [Segetibacter sp.]MCW3081588.1 EamA/RhaT family transporter [Segetibacter sp.]
MKNALYKLHIAVFLWGFTGVLGRLISLNEGLLVWYRLIITIATLYFLMRAKKQLESVSNKQRWQLFGIGGLLAFHWCFFYGSIKYSNVSIALTCLSSTGLFTALLEPLISRKKLVVTEVLLGLLAIVGIYLIFHFDPQYKIGIILGVVAALLTCIFSVLNKSQVSYNAPKTVMLYELCGGFLLLTILLPLYLYLLPTDRWVPVKGDYIWLLLLSWVCTIAAMDLSLQALQKVSAFTQNLTLNLEPVYGIVLAFVVYNENKYLSKWFYYGFALILLAVILQMLRIIKSRKRLVSY